MSTLQPSPEQLAEITAHTHAFVRTLKQALQKTSLQGQVFVGGSFAKRTLLAQDTYDVDIFIRLKEVTPSVIDQVEKLLKKLHPKITRVHGSRDYFQVPASPHLIFEIVPVKAIRKPQDMENVTDLSYFHVAYVKKKMTPQLSREIALTKAFCVGAGVYGAESYIQGFSGYALECLLIQYTTLSTLLRKLSKASTQLVLDPAKHYRSLGEMTRAMSESRRNGPLVIVDPTWPARNVAAALSPESFALFQKRAQAYLKKPSERFFTEEPFSLEKLQKEANKKHAFLCTISLETNKQAGDIAGTKLKKFHTLLTTILEDRFTVVRGVFRYAQGQTSVSYFMVKQKEVIQQGPLLSMTKHALAFKKAHPSAHIAKGRYYVRLPAMTPEKYITQKVSTDLLKQMDMNRMQID